MALRGAIVLALVSGCSFVFVDGPAADRAVGAPVDCTSVPVAPVIDTGLAVLGVVGAVVAQQRLGEPEGDDFPNNDFLRMQRTFSIIGAVIEGASAGYGFVKTRACRRARASAR
jgi:hypothetical protein